MAHNIEETNQRTTSARKVPALSRPTPKPKQSRGLTKIERDKQISHNLADQAARKQAESESRRRYHAAWQEYYQKYYEHYYLKQLGEQKRQSAKDPSEKLSSKQQAIDELRKDLLGKISENADKVKKSKHFKPILAGIIAVLLIAFIQYNQLFNATIHSWLSPGNESGVIITADSSNHATNQTPTIIIPKLSVKAPILFDIGSQSEFSSQKALEQGVINYPVEGASARPGQNGNTVIMGHSSSDVFNSGEYKFIFVQLNRLILGDLFYIDYEGIRYSYEIIDKKIIAPTDIHELDMGDSAPYATLVTCDPPGTTLNRLIVIGRQISPNPDNAKDQQSAPDNAGNQDIPGSPPTLFERLFNF
jgi:LPXTG-site transpeptidase (sortase) family protein